MIPWIKYYLFLKKDHPISAKYGVLQKIAYIATPFLDPGGCLHRLLPLGPDVGVAVLPRGHRLGRVAVQLGGGGDPMGMRIVHYWIMWVILIFTAAHVYLANIYNFAPSRMIFAVEGDVRDEDS